MMSEAEIWRPIPGWEGLYDASSFGRIRSHHRGGRIKQPVKSSDGYPMVVLHGPNGRHGHNVHRLVCMAFHGLPPEGKNEAAHLDGSRTNSRPDNLAWASRIENLSHRNGHGTILAGERHPRAKLTANQVVEIRRALSSGYRVADIARGYGVNWRTIGDIRDGKRWRDSPVAKPCAQTQSEPPNE